MPIHFRQLNMCTIVYESKDPKVWTIAIDSDLSAVEWFNKELWINKEENGKVLFSTTDFELFIATVRTVRANGHLVTTNDTTPWKTFSDELAPAGPVYYSGQVNHRTAGEAFKIFYKVVSMGDHYRGFIGCDASNASGINRIQTQLAKANLITNVHKSHNNARIPQDVFWTGVDLVDSYRNPYCLDRAINYISHEVCMIRSDQ